MTSQPVVKVGPETPPRWRRLPFDRLAPADHWMIRPPALTNEPARLFMNSWPSVYVSLV